MTNTCNHEIGSEPSIEWGGGVHKIHIGDRFTELPDVEGRNNYCPTCGNVIDWVRIAELVEINKETEREQLELQRQQEQQRFDALSPEQQKVELERKKHIADSLKELSKLMGMGTSMADDLKANNQTYRAFNNPEHD